jgi:hypothetical protein
MQRIVITAAMLRGMGVCREQYKLFKRTFPEGCAVTRRNARKAMRTELDLEWFAVHFLGGVPRDRFLHARSEAIKREAIKGRRAWNAYGKAVEVAKERKWKAIDGSGARDVKKIAAEVEKCSKAKRTARVKYQKKCIAARKERDEKIGIALVDAIRLQDKLERSKTRGER